MIALLIILPLVALIVGVASGFVLGIRQTARMIARMDTAQLDELADRVWEARHGGG